MQIKLLHVSYGTNTSCPSRQPPDQRSLTKRKFLDRSVAVLVLGLVTVPGQVQPTGRYGWMMNDLLVGITGSPWEVNNWNLVAVLKVTVWAEVIQWCEGNDHGRKVSHADLYLEVLWGSQHAIIKYTLASGANDSLQLATNFRLRAGLRTALVISTHFKSNKSC